MRGATEKDRPGKIFVGGLPIDLDEKRLEKTFAKYGRIIEILLIRDKMTQQSRGYGFITYENPQDGDDAVKGMEGQMLEGKELHVEQAVKAVSSQPGRGRGGFSRGRGGPPMRGGRGMGRGMSDRGRGRGGPPSRSFGRGSRGGPPGRVQIGIREPRSSYGRLRDYGSSGDHSSRPSRDSRDYPSSLERERGRDYPPRRDDYPPSRRDDYPSSRAPPSRDDYPPSRRDDYPPRRDDYSSRDRDYGSSRDYPPSSSSSRDYGAPPSSRDYSSLSSRDYSSPSSRSYPSLERSRDYPPPERSRDYPPPERSRDYPPRDYAAPSSSSRDYSSTPSSRDYPPLERDYGSSRSSRDYDPAPPRDYHGSSAPSPRDSFSSRPYGNGRDPYTDDFDSRPATTAPTDFSSYSDYPSRSSTRSHEATPPSRGAPLSDRSAPPPYARGPPGGERDGYGREPASRRPATLMDGGPPLKRLRDDSFPSSHIMGPPMSGPPRGRGSPRGRPPMHR